MHVGIIPDGNRRWAKRSQASVHEAYAIGFLNSVDVTIFLCELGATNVTFFGLSASNFAKRQPDQIKTVMAQMFDSMIVAVNVFNDYRVAVQFYGNVLDLSRGQRDSLNRIEALTNSRSGSPATRLSVLINYDLEWDLDNWGQRRTTAHMPPCDLVFRSGGMKRLSGFLPKQTASAELIFSTKLWPDIRRADLATAVAAWRRVPKNLGA